MSEPGAEASEELAVVPKHPLPTRWFHWVNFPLLAVMVWSGALIYWADASFTLFGLPLYHDGLFRALGLAGRLAEGMGWHFAFAWLFAVNGFLYVAYTAFSGQWRHLVPGKGTFREAWQVALHDLRIRKEPPPRRKFNGAQRIAYTGVVVMGFFSLLTGLAIYKPVQVSWLTFLFGGYPAARLIHFWLTVGYCVFFVVHVAQVARAGWNNFRAMVTGWEEEGTKGPRDQGTDGIDGDLKEWEGTDGHGGTNGDDQTHRSHLSHPAQSKVSRLSRRSFLWMGGAVASVFAGWRWLLAQPKEQKLLRPFRRAHEFNEGLWSSISSPERLSPEFPRSQAREPRQNGTIGEASNVNLARYLLSVRSRFVRQFTLEELQELGAVDVTTELRCIEGWSEVVHWTGVPLGKVLGEVDDIFTHQPYVFAETMDGKYFVGLDVWSAAHPQTLVCWAMNGEPLTEEHGAPLRLVVPVKYGIKSLKWLGRIEVTSERPKDYWAERGYDWHSGH